MMGVYIKGMEMPNNCRECPLETDYGTCGYYSLFVEAGHESSFEKRREDCPLVPVPEHGRLIDADALMANAEYKGKYDILTAYDVVAAPTIIPADKEGDNDG